MVFGVIFAGLECFFLIIPYLGTTMKLSFISLIVAPVSVSRDIIVLYLCAQCAVLYTYNCLPGGRIVLFLCAQLAVLYTYNCLLRMICYRLGQNQLLINKYTVLSRYSLWPIKLVMDYRTSSLYTL